MCAAFRTVAYRAGLIPARMAELFRWSKALVGAKPPWAPMRRFFGQGVRIEVQ